jgi:hypothetical protein
MCGRSNARRVDGLGGEWFCNDHQPLCAKFLSQKRLSLDFSALNSSLSSSLSYSLSSFIHGPFQGITRDIPAQKNRSRGRGFLFCICALTCRGTDLKIYFSRWATPARSSSSSLRVASIFARENSSISNPFTRSYLPLAHVTGTPYITPSGMP